MKTIILLMSINCDRTKPSGSGFFNCTRSAGKVYYSHIEGAKCPGAVTPRGPVTGTAQSLSAYFYALGGIK